MNTILRLCVLALTIGMIGDCCSASSPASSSYEEDYQAFLKVKLVFCPKQGSDVGKIVLPIKDLLSPLEGAFDLSRCGITGQFLSIATGYPKTIQEGNADKIEVWIAPRSLIEKNLNTTAGHFKGIMSNWPSTVPVGIFWRWGGWNNLDWMDYLTTNSLEEIADNNLYRKYQFSENSDEEHYNTTGMNMLKEHWRSMSCYKLEP